MDKQKTLTESRDGVSLKGISTAVCARLCRVGFQGGKPLWQDEGRLCRTAITVVFFLARKKSRYVIAILHSPPSPTLCGGRSAMAGILPASAMRWPVRHALPGGGLSP